MDLYEQKYKEALEWMRSVYDGLHGATKEDAEHYFPELKEFDDERIRKEILGLVQYTKGRKIGYEPRVHQDEMVTWLEKQGEQKPVDKVEPKFQKGDWVCENEPNNYARFVQILETVNIQGKERYRISRDIHNDEDIVEFNFVEEYYHKFDIKDAKDGDVLVSSEGNPFIFSGKYDDMHFCNPIAYCGVTCENKFKEGGGTHWTSKGGVAPATKEQRDLLFQKMKEEGYEWDAKKKVLKKIEPKTLDADKVIAWLEENVADFWVSPCNPQNIINQFKKDFGL